MPDTAQSPASERYRRFDAYVDTHVETDGEFTIAGLVSQAKSEGVDIMELLKNHLPVVEVSV